MNTDKELIEHMLQGGLLQQTFSDDSVGYFWIEDGRILYSFDVDKRPLVSNIKLDLASCTFKDLKWYHIIPEEGILCWVFDGMKTLPNKSIKYVFSKDASGYMTRGMSWQNAIPLTLDEVVLYNKLYKVGE